LGVYADRADFSFLFQDVCQPTPYQGEIHYFIHAASPAGIKERHADPVATFMANVQGCANMLKLALHNPCQGFLLLSSVDVYGKMPGADRLKESDCGTLDTINPRNAYANGKRAAESLCAACFAKHKLPIKIVRPFQIVGPGLKLDDGRLHIDFIAQMLAGDKIVLKGDGTAKRTFLYMTDAISGMLTVLSMGVPGEVYNVVDESGEASVMELARLMAALVADRKIAVAFDYEQRNTIEVTSAPSIVTGSSDKIKTLGWYPEISLRDGAKRMMKYYGLTTE
jgi:nucleoside-diphosphate-sugar epimerase